MLGRREPTLPYVRRPRGLTWRQHVADWMWPQPEPVISVDRFLAEVRTGDVLLWESGALWVKWWTWSPWTHVSLAWRDPETGETGQWQSTTHVGCTDILTGEFDRHGVQLNPLAASVRRYLREYGRLAWRPLLMRDGGSTMRPPPGADPRTDRLNAGFRHAMRETKGLPFRPGWPMMGGRDPLLQFCPGPLGYSTDFSGGMFCAVHSAYTLQLGGVLDKAWPPWNYSPASFDDRSDQLLMRDGWEYGRLHRVVL